MTDGFSDLLDRLHGGRAGADDANPLAGNIDALLGPAMGMAGQAFECIDAGNVRHCRRRENANRGNQKTRRKPVTTLKRNLPAASLFLVMRRVDAAVELNVATQVEFVGDIVEIALGLGLGREVL